jgi:hypothetical protein
MKAVDELHQTSYIGELPGMRSALEPQPTDQNWPMVEMILVKYR